MNLFYALVFSVLFSQITSASNNPSKEIRGNDKDELTDIRKAAGKGLVMAQFNLGAAYANGPGVRKDDSEAVKWYRKAAEQGLAEAQIHLALKCHLGQGVSKDQAAADRRAKQR